MKYVIEVNNLKKSFPSFRLDIDKLKIPSGVIIGLIGENGAGKTTLIKLLLNIIKKDDGKIKIFRQDLLENEILIKEDIGVVLDNSFFPENLTPKNINTIMSNVYKNWDSNLFYEYLKKFNISESQTLKTMSKGMRKKTEIATSLAHHPKLLILDEATSGLDPIVRSDVLDILLDFIQDDEHTVILSTHITSDLEHIADDIIFIHNGHVVLNTKRDDITDSYGIVKCNEEEFLSMDKKEILSFKKNKYHYEVLVSNRNKIKKKYKDYVIDKATIEDVMLLMIKGGEVK